jgi:hypothetical protein
MLLGAGPSHEAIELLAFWQHLTSSGTAFHEGPECRFCHPDRAADADAKQCPGGRQATYRAQAYVQLVGYVPRSEKPWD